MWLIIIRDYGVIHAITFKENALIFFHNVKHFGSALNVWCNMSKVAVVLFSLQWFFPQQIKVGKGDTDFQKEWQ